MELLGKPAKKKKNPKAEREVGEKAGSMASVSSMTLFKDAKPKKQKPLTKKEKEKMKQLERDLKEALVQLRVDADQALAEFKALEDAAERKAKTELSEHNKRVELLAETCETFKMVKARLLHENNKLRDAEIWDRYITTDRMPYPENVPNMRDHLYLWRQDKSTEFMEFALSRCASYVDTLKKLDELIEHPLYATNATVNNWKELRREWREEFLYKLDKASFNMIKNLAKNFKQDSSQNHIYSFEADEEHLEVGLCAYVKNDSLMFVPKELIKVSPKITFSSAKTEIVMPAAYRTTPFILRLIHLDQDFFSESSYTYYCPESLHMEPNLLHEIHRCFEAKKEAKSLVADREREKVRQAKKKVLEIQAAVNLAEKSFQTFQQQAVDQGKLKKRDSKISMTSESASIPEEKKEPKKKNPRKDIITVTKSSENSIFGPGGHKGPRGVMDDDGQSVAKSLMQSAGAKRTLDAISLRSGLRKKHDRFRKIDHSSSMIEPEHKNIFYTSSMISLSNRVPKVEVRRDSELCFESGDSESKLDMSLHDAEKQSYDSLDMMFGIEDEDEFKKVRPVRELVKHTVIVDRDSNKAHRATRPGMSFSIESKKGRRRGKSTANFKGKPVDDSDDTHQTASEVFEASEEMRQEQYMSSLLFQMIPHKQIHINLRAHVVVGGTYILDIIFHESQPHRLCNGNTVQMFYGEMNIKRDYYKYDYKPPPLPGPDDDPLEPIKDPGLQHLLHVKVSLPKDLVFLEAPFVALWDSELKFWTKEHVHKLIVDMDSLTASFSIDRVLPFAFFLSKYYLLPFVAWHMKPKLDTAGVELSLHCVRALFEFQVVGFQACLSRAVMTDGETIPQLLGVIGEFMHIDRLIDMMKSKGLNIFPDEDALLYVQCNSKDVVLEDHTYLSMAMFADCLEFTSSDSNMDFKRQKLSFRVRECLGYNMELRYRTIVATSLSCQMYRSAHSDFSLEDAKLEPFGFCPDVYYLLQKAFAYSSPATPNPLQILAVYSLLSRIKVLSYSGIIQKEASTVSSSHSKRSIRKKKKGQQKMTKSIKSRTSGQSLSVMSTASAKV